MGRKFVSCTICGLCMTKDKMRDHLQSGHEGGLRRVETNSAVTYERITLESNERRRNTLPNAAQEPKAKKKRSQASKPEQRPVMTRSEAVGHARARFWS